MAININPNRINTQPGTLNKPAGGRQEQASGGERIIIPAKAVVNNIPAAETLHTMIRSAVEALRKGVSWERGTILNIVV